jgi:hypothetical protein
MSSTTSIACTLAGLIAAASCSSPAPAAPAQQEPQHQAQPPHPTAAQFAAQKQAEMQQARAQEEEFLKGLDAAVTAEARNEAWAKQKETELRKFSVPKGMRASTLKSVECRSTKCALRFQVSTDPKSAIEQQAGIDYWVAANQPCEYTLTTAPDAAKTAGLVRVFLNCAPR